MVPVAIPDDEHLAQFADKPVITIAAGATCAYLGDERNLREFLVADETARRLRQKGHTVFLLLIDDSMDPLNARQLRVAVNKDETLLERFKSWCGKPIAHVPDPWGCHESYAAHFEDQLMCRLHALDCHPTLVSTAKVYERGMYAPYVRTVLERHDEILTFLRNRFPGYQPDRLFWALCPHCGHIDETRITAVKGECVFTYCQRCRRAAATPIDAIQGKLNWKLDCAVRWTLFHVDAEPFNKAYLEPQTGTYVVAQELSRRFFGGHGVRAIPYGLVKMEKGLGYKLLEALPGGLLRNLLLKRPAADITLTRDLMLTAASQHEVEEGLSYLDFVKQLLPMWLLTPESLTTGQRDLVAHGMAFSRHFLQEEVGLQLPSREHLEQEDPAILSRAHALLVRAIRARQEAGSSFDAFDALMKPAIHALGSAKKAVLLRLRRLVGQERGLPALRFLFLLPLSYLQTLEFLLELYLHSQTTAAESLLPSELRAFLQFSTGARGAADTAPVAGGVS
jgi:hypothetical protein